jgi:hypothetical protein
MNAHSGSLQLLKQESGDSEVFELIFNYQLNVHRVVKDTQVEIY